MDQEKIGNFMATLRKEKNLTQEELAEKLCVNVKSVSRWETGRNLPDPAMMKEICKIFDISVDELFLGERTKKKKTISRIFFYYTLVSLTGIFVLPILGVVAPVFILSSIFCLLAGFLKLIAYIFHFDIPIIMFQIGSYSLHPIPVFLLSTLISIFLYFVGMGAWKLLMQYIHFLSEKKKSI